MTDRDSTDIAMDKIKDLLKAFQQNNMQADYLILLDKLSDFSCKRYDILHDGLKV